MEGFDQLLLMSKGANYTSPSNRSISFLWDTGKQFCSAFSGLKQDSYVTSGLHRKTKY